MGIYKELRGMSMSNLSVKQVIVVAIVTILTVTQIPLSVLAAINDETFAAAEAGIQYLAKNQSTDGSITGFGGETEWATIAIVSGSKNPAGFHNGGASIIDFLKSTTPTATAPATDIERKIIAVSAAGLDGADFNGVNYNSLLKNYHLSNQIGDTTLLNDDVFGVIAVDATNDSTLHTMAQDGLNYFLAHQQVDGGFSYTTNTCDFYCGSDSNDTAAAIIAMHAAENMGLTNTSLTDSKTKAIAYLLSTQKEDGGFGYDAFSPSDGSSTAWSLMALNTIVESVQAQAIAARNWLIANQNDDGGFSFGAYGFTLSDTYTTAHAVTALLGTNWLLHPTPIHNTVQASPTVNENTPAKAVPISPTKNRSSAIVPAIATTSSPKQVAQGSVLGAATTTELQKETTKEAPAAQANHVDIGKVAAAADTSKRRYMLYVLLASLFLALVGYMFQRRHKKQAA